MANSKVYQVGTVAKLGTTFDTTIGNTIVGSTAVTNALTADTYYAYVDGYTYNSNGSQQGTGLGYCVKVVFRLGQPDLDKRTIPVYACAYFRRTDYIGSNNTMYLNLSINGDSASYAEFCSMSSVWLKTVTKTSVLSYNDDGSLPITIDLTGGNNRDSCSKIVCKFNITPPDIGEKSMAITATLSETNLTIGSTKCTLTHDKDLTGHCTDIILYFKNDANAVIYRKVLFSKNTQKVVEFTPELEAIAKVMPNETSHTAFVNIRTFDLKDTSTIIGQKNIKVKLLIPSSVKYSISSIEASSTGAGFVVGQDYPQAVITINDSKAYGATISKIDVKFNTDVVTVNNPVLTGGKITVTSDKPFSTTNQSIVVTLTDSRGKIVTKTTTFNTDDLTAAPTIRTLNVGRGTGTSVSNWVDNDEGKNCIVKYEVRSNKVKGEVQAGRPGNPINITVEYKKSNEPDFTTFTYTAPSNNTGEVSDRFVIPINDVVNAYIIRITASDGYASIYRETTLSIGYILAEVHESGKGIAFGQKCDTEGFNVNMVTTFKQAVYNAAGSVAITSDESRKDEINPLTKMFNDEDIRFLFEFIDPISFKYKNVESDRTHMGFSANKIEEALEALHKKPENLSLVESITERIRVLNDGARDTWMENTFLTLKYDELIPIMWYMIKILMGELQSIKKQMEENTHGSN